MSDYHLGQPETARNNDQDSNLLTATLTQKADPPVSNVPYHGEQVDPSEVIELHATSGGQDSSNPQYGKQAGHLIVKHLNVHDSGSMGKTKNPVVDKFSVVENVYYEL